MVNSVFKQYSGTAAANAARDEARRDELKGVVESELGGNFLGAIHDVKIRRRTTHYSGGSTTFEKVAVEFHEDVPEEQRIEISEAVSDYFEPRGIKHVSPEELRREEADLMAVAPSFMRNELDEVA